MLNMEISIDFDETEEVQRSLLPSESEAGELIPVDDDEFGYERYLQEMQQRGLIRPELPKEERWEEMENGAMRVFEEGVNNPNLPFKERRATAEKIFEIRGILGKKGSDSGGGNTFVFSDQAAGNIAKLLSAMGRGERDVTE